MVTPSCDVWEAGARRMLVVMGGRMETLSLREGSAVSWTRGRKLYSLEGRMLGQADAGRGLSEKRGVSTGEGVTETPSLQLLTLCAEPGWWSAWAL